MLARDPCPVNQRLCRRIPFSLCNLNNLRENNMHASSQRAILCRRADHGGRCNGVHPRPIVPSRVQRQSQAFVRHQVCTGTFVETSSLERVKVAQGGERFVALDRSRTGSLRLPMPNKIPAGKERKNLSRETPSEKYKVRLLAPFTVVKGKRALKNDRSTPGRGEDVSQTMSDTQPHRLYIYASNA